MVVAVVKAILIRHSSLLILVCGVNVYYVLVLYAKHGHITGTYSAYRLQKSAQNTNSKRESKQEEEENKKKGKKRIRTASQHREASMGRGLHRPPLPPKRGPGSGRRPRYWPRRVGSACRCGGSSARRYGLWIMDYGGREGFSLGYSYLGCCLTFRTSLECRGSLWN